MLYKNMGVFDILTSNKERAADIGCKVRRMIWIISGKNLPTLEIVANSFDEALAKSRTINKNYNTGVVKE